MKMLEVGDNASVGQDRDGGPDPEFQAFMQRQSKNPAGRMIKAYTASQS